MLEPWQKALLDTISGPESGGRYNVIYGGRKFSDFSQHPGVNVPIISGPNVGKTSSAAGRYQFIRPTWEAYQKKLGLSDFSPASQDQAAWALASDTYKTKTGQDLNAVLQSGDPNAIAGVGSALKETWTSLPGGIEAGTNTDKFVKTFNAALGNPSVTPGAVASTSPEMMQAMADVAAESTAATTSQLAATQGLGSVTSPFTSLLSMMTASQKPQNVEVNRTVVSSEPIDPVAETEATSQTPDVYKRLKRRA